MHKLNSIQGAASSAMSYVYNVGLSSQGYLGVFLDTTVVQPLQNIQDDVAKVLDEMRPGIQR